MKEWRNRDTTTPWFMHEVVISQYDYVNDAVGRRSEISRSGSRMSEQRTDAYGYNMRDELVFSRRDA